MTSCQSASGIRASTPSRVRPALLTRMSSSPTSSTSRFAAARLGARGRSSRGLASAERLLELRQAGGAVDGDRVDVAIDPFDQTGEDVPWADLDERLHALP